MLLGHLYKDVSAPFWVGSEFKVEKCVKTYADFRAIANFSKSLPKKILCRIEGYVA